MKATAAREKGNEFERLMCKRMSLWLSAGQRRDLFMRNVASGGAFTLSARRGSPSGVGGDMMAVHPLAHDFLEVFLTEYKHWRDLNFEAALWMNRGEFAQVLTKAERQAIAAQRHYFIVAKQNHRAPILLMPHDVGLSCATVLRSHAVRHSLWGGRMFACLLDDVLGADPVEFIRLAREILVVREPTNARGKTLLARKVGAVPLPGGGAGGITAP